MTLEEQYVYYYKKLADVSKQMGSGDPFSYARSKEILAAVKLGHVVAKKYSGADAYLKTGEPVEYKSTIQSSVKASYTGISVQETWEQQVKYLKEEKILKYPFHFMNRFKDGELVESWRLTGQQVYDILLPKLEKQFTARQGNSDVVKDPRLGATISNTEIVKNGVRVI